MNEKKHLEYIDQLKGIAILLVIWGHSDSGANYFYDALYHLHIPVFLLCTGMLLNYKNSSQNPISMICKLCGRLMYPFLMFGFISIFVFMCMNATANMSFSLKYRLKEILTLGYDACWFLPALFIGESVTILVIYLFEKKIKKGIFVIVGMAVTLLVAEILRRLLWGNYAEYSSDNFLAGEKMELLLVTSRSLIFAFYILVGYMLFPGLTKMTESIHKRKNLSIIASVGGLALFVLMFFVINKSGYADLRLVNWGGDPTIVYLISCMAISVPLILFFMVSRLQIRFFAFLGKHSLVVMGVHISMQKVWLSRMLIIKYAPAELMQRPTLNSIVAAILALILVIPEIYIFDKAFPFLVDWEKAKQIVKSKITRQL